MRTQTLDKRGFRPGERAAPGFWQALIATDEHVSATIMRLALAAVIFPHGAQKMLGWYGGEGFEGTIAFFTGQMGIPAIFAVLVILAEFAGSILLLFGLLTRVAAFGILTVMVVAILMVHLPNGFFMNWSGTQTGEGFEYHILAAGLALALLLHGGGALSLDRALTRINVRRGT